MNFTAQKTKNTASSNIKKKLVIAQKPERCLQIEYRQYLRSERPYILIKALRYVKFLLLLSIK